jgi:hypothetical protein
VVWKLLELDVDRVKVSREIVPFFPLGVDSADLDRFKKIFIL